MTDKKFNHGLILDFTKNKKNVDEMIKNLRQAGFDTLSGFDDRFSFLGRRSWDDRYCACIIIKDNFIAKDELQIYHEAYEHLPIFEIKGWNEINVDEIKAFLGTNNCKHWKLENIIEETINRTKCFLYSEMPLIDVSESIYSVIAAILTKKAIGERANRFVFYDRGFYSFDKVVAYLSGLENIGIKAEYLDIRDTFKSEPKSANRKTMHNYLTEIHKIHEEPLKELYGDTYNTTALVSTNKRAYAGVLYNYVHLFSSICDPYHFIKTVLPCNRFYKSEFDNIANVLELPDKIVELTKSLFEDKV